jgi:WhiB family transcriptional regulator, redox-sensing transcriptional regulator
VTPRGHLRVLKPSDAAGSWRTAASCRDGDPEMFFPVGDPEAVLEVVEQAKAVCRICPVREACLQYALETKQVDGIWGGTTEDERRRLRRAWVAARRLRAG